ncbi:MMPL family transporter [Priestia megaterium]|uniref:MMPL family transporter n=1 Tax=Priestia megaterium TaxID=1404 RepID=UPI001B39D2AB|nr:MMPL family transporter [Priestia megaterium]MBQ4869247.1 MMPL family transporter [Priestia megaterium]
MAKYLYKLGEWASRKRRQVVFGWIAILIVAAIGVGTMGITFNDDMSIPGTKAEKAMDVLNKEFPRGDDSGGQIKLIFKAPKGETLESPSTQKKIQDTLDLVLNDKAVESIASPYQTGTISKNKEIGYATITYKVNADKVTDASKNKIKGIAKLAEKSGVQTEIGGTVAFSHVKIDGTSELVGVVIAFGILVFTFASFLAAGLPIITAIIGLGIGAMGILISSNFFSVQATSLSLASMIGLAVGIDYALFIISRHRQQLAQGLDVRESIARATATAGSAVLFAGLTVIVALCGLSVVGIPFLTSMGLSAAFTVLIVLLVSITLVPALLGMVGHRLSPKQKKHMDAKKPLVIKQNKESNKWGRFVTRYPIQIVLVCLIITGIISSPVRHMELGLPDNGMKSKETIERRAYDLMAEGFGDGINGSLVIVLDGSKSTNTQVSFAKVAKELSDLPNVSSVSPPTPNQSGKFAMVTVLPQTGPNDSKTKDLVTTIREKAQSINKDEKIKLIVTGSTAVNIDISDKLSEALPQFAALIVIFALLLLLVVFRSILVPIKAVLGFLMTLIATLGFSVFVLQDGHFIDFFGIPEAGPLLNFMPVLTTGILFGLAMDYEVFLVSRMREDYTHLRDVKKSILSSLKHSGPVVTAAGLIMISVFASFIFAEDSTIKATGLSMAFGVLFDAFVVRMTLVPAVMTLLGKSAWYLPKWLDKSLPTVDIEGESLMNNVEDHINNKVRKY